MPEEKGSPTDRVVKEGFMEEGDLLLDLEKRISFCKSEGERCTGCQRNTGLPERKISNLEAVFLKLIICISYFYDVLLFA